MSEHDTPRLAHRPRVKITVERKTKDTNGSEIREEIIIVLKNVTNVIFTHKAGRETPTGFIPPSLLDAKFFIVGQKEPIHFFSASDLEQIERQLTGWDV